MKRTEQEVCKQSAYNKGMTLLKAIENVVEVSKDSKLNATAMRKMTKDIKYLSERFGITERQAILFSICMEKGPRHVDFDDLANHLDVRQIRILCYADDIDALVRRRLLCYRDKDEDCFDVPAAVIKGLKHNEAYALPKQTDLDCFGLFEAMNNLFEDLNNEALTPSGLYESLTTLFNDNPQVDFVKKIKQANIKREKDWLLLVFFCHSLINKEDDDIRFGQIESLFESNADFNNAKRALRNDEHRLISKGFIGHVCEDGIASPSRLNLTESAKQNLLSEFKLTTTEDKIADVIKSDDLTKKEMFYVEANRKQVEELHSFLNPEKYNEIRKRMKTAGFRTGFACLFYGGPGTGKTETAYQLARETGRDIMVVDVPQIKSKWVGDSEKNIKALFDRYRSLVQKTNTTIQDDSTRKPAPILLFNEADAIIGIRKQGASSAVDKMENSIQNIILQEMETLDGIMIATTNLTENLDTAFERRFLYKIRFEKPDASVRQRLWQSMMPGLSDADAHILASDYDFSGGQIENISRKATINAILHGEESNDLARLAEYCKSERLDKQGRRKIGF